MNPIAAKTLETLLEGNERFRTGEGIHYRYPPALISELASGQHPQAAIVACSDGRVSPETIFDQPLASLFVSRVPGNVASDSAKWMLEIAVTNLQVPLVIVMGHTECLAIKQVLDGAEGAGGSLRMNVSRAVHSAKMRGGPDIFVEAVKENALQAAETLRTESIAVRQALQAGQLDLVTALYDVHTGQVELLMA